MKQELLVCLGVILAASVVNHFLVGASSYKNFVDNLPEHLRPPKMIAAFGESY